MPPYFCGSVFGTTAIVTSAPERRCAATSAGDVDVGQRVAVGDEERRRAEQRQRLSRAAGGAQDRHLPRVPDAHVEVRSVADDTGEGVRQVMQVEHRVGDAGRAQLPQDPRDERLSRHGQRGLGADERERTQAGGEPRGQDQRRDHSSRKTMWALPKPNFSRC